MHFCAVVARLYARLSKPRKTSLNWFIPAFVNSSVGSSPGTTGLEATIAWPFDSKNFRNVERISEAFIGCRSCSREAKRRFYAAELPQRPGGASPGAPSFVVGSARNTAFGDV